MPAAGHEARPSAHSAAAVPATSDGNAAEPVLRVFPGCRSEIRKVRSFVSSVIGNSLVADDIVLLASELASNAVQHTASGEYGTFTVVIRPGDSTVLVEVHDGGSDTVPSVRPADGPSESGRGLCLIAGLAERWGHLGGPDGRVVWFEVAR